MRKDDLAGARKANAVNQAGMVGLVGEDRVVRAKHRAEQAHVGRVAGAEIERRLAFR